MDADTRHHLKQNELAEALGKLKSLDKSTVYFVAAILAVILLFAAYRVWGWQSQQAVYGNWAELAQYEPFNVDAGPNTVKELRDLVATGADRKLTNVARLKLAATLVNMADKDAVQRDAYLTEAETVLTEVTESATAVATIAAPAEYLVARICESKRDVEGARRAYEHLTDARFNGSQFQTLAKQKLETLDQLTETVTFVAGEAPKPEPLPEQAGPPAAPTIVPVQVPAPTTTPEPATEETPTEDGAEEADSPEEAPEETPPADEPGEPE